MRFLATLHYLEYNRSVNVQTKGCDGRYVRHEKSCSRSVLSNLIVKHNFSFESFLEICDLLVCSIQCSELSGLPEAETR